MAKHAPPAETIIGSKRHVLLAASLVVRSKSIVDTPPLGYTARVRQAQLVDIERHYSTWEQTGVSQSGLDQRYRIPSTDEITVLLPIPGTPRLPRLAQVSQGVEEGLPRHFLMNQFCHDVVWHSESHHARIF